MLICSVAVSNYEDIEDELKNEFIEQNDEFNQLIKEIQILISDKCRLEEKIIEFSKGSSSYEKLEEQYKDRCREYEYMVGQLNSYQKKEQLALENCDKIQAKYDQLKIEFEQMKLDMANLAKDKETCEMDYEAEISTYKFKLDERDNKIERLEAECDEFQFKYSSKTGGASAIKTIEFIAEIEGCKRDYEMNLEILEEMWHRKVNLSEIEIETYRKKISEYRDIIKELKLSKYEMTIRLDRLEAESEEQTREHKIMI